MLSTWKILEKNIVQSGPIKCDWALNFEGKSPKRDLTNILKIFDLEKEENYAKLLIVTIACRFTCYFFYIAISTTSRP